MDVQKRAFILWSTCFWALAGALIGSIIGAWLMSTYVLNSCSGIEGGGDSDAGEVLIILTRFGAVVGAVIGSFIGVWLSRRWHGGNQRYREPIYPRVANPLGSEVHHAGRARKTATKVHIDRMVKRIVKKFDPEQIILFGSQARGDAGPDSDVDLLIVMPVEGSVFEKGLEIHQALHDVPFPVDVVVTTPAEFAWRKEYVGTIEWPATREGKVLYART